MALGAHCKEAPLALDIRRKAFQFNSNGWKAPTGGKSMYKSLAVFALLIMIPSLSAAQNKHSPYAGQEKREVKALSPEDMEGYLTGQGMGYAKAAELNHYPGPKHVLELTEQLHLRKEQLDRTKEIYIQMHKAAVSIGRQIVERERVLDHLFADKKIDEKSLRKIAIEIGRLQGELRTVHLKAHLKMKEILLPGQIDKYDEARGYGGSGEINRHQHDKYHGGHR